jgi:hypothetical protein
MTPSPLNHSISISLNIMVINFPPQVQSRHGCRKGGLGRDSPDPFGTGAELLGKALRGRGCWELKVCMFEE